MSDNQPSEAYFEDEAFLSNDFGDQYLYSVNRQLFNAAGAEAVYQEYLPSAISQTNSLFVVIGSDSGLLIEHIAKHGVPSGSRYLFVELDGVVDQVAQRVKPLLSGSIILSDLAHWTQEAESLGYKNYLYMNQVTVIQSLGAKHAYLPAYLELARLVKTETTSWEWYLRQQYAFAHLIECQLANAGENRTPLSALKDQFKGKSATLIASGPSLDDMIPWIQKNRDKLLVAAISRSCRRLIDAGIKPDLVVTIDPNNFSFEISREMLLLDPDVLLVNAYHAVPRLIAQWRGPKVYMGSQLPWKEEADNTFQGITVSNAAVEALMAMGCSQIILAGVDLCFKPDGSLYSSGTMENDVGPVLGHIGPKVETNEGQVAETSDGYVQGIRNLAEQAVLAKLHGCTLINPAPSAAKIAGVEFRSIDDISLVALDEPPSSTVNRCLQPDDRQHRLDHYAKIDHELANVTDRVTQVEKFAREILDCLDGLFGRHGKKANPKYQQQIIKIEAQMENEFPQELIMVKQFAIGEFMRFYGRGNIGKRQLHETENDGRRYYEAFCDGAQKLIEVINNSRLRIASRIAEESLTPDFKAISKQWQKDIVPGRALVWRHYHPQAYAALTAEEQAIYDNEAAKFQLHVTNPNPGHMHYCRRQVGLENVPSKTKLLFYQRDVAGLRNLVEGLNKFHGDNAEAQALSHFASGCLAEIEQRYEDALAHFQLITEGPLLEDALLHISQLCLQMGNVDNTLLALECLAQMSINYVPAYAEVAWRTGHVKEATELFSQYLQLIPSDLKTYMRLGRLYLREGLEEDARMAFTHVLEQDPDNQSARAAIDALGKPQTEKECDSA